MSEKSCPFLYNELLYKNGQVFFNLFLESLSAIIYLFFAKNNKRKWQKQYLQKTRVHKSMSNKACTTALELIEGFVVQIILSGESRRTKFYVFMDISWLVNHPPPQWKSFFFLSNVQVGVIIKHTLFNPPHFLIFAVLVMYVQEVVTTQKKYSDIFASEN